MSVSAAALVNILREQELRIFTTGDLMTLAGLSGAAATHALERLAKHRLVTRLKRGLWANRLVVDLHPYEAVPYLRAPWPTYVSLQSALSDYGLIEEVPQVIYALSSAMPRRFVTGLGAFHFHHLPVRLIWGYEMKTAGRSRYPLADPEKAFLDLAYLALTPRSRLEVPPKRGRRWKLDRNRLGAYARRFEWPPLSAWLRENNLD